MHRSAKRVWHVVAAAIAVLLAYTYFAPSALASCGDYVTIVPHGAMPTGSPAEPVTWDEQPAPRELPCPCERGPLERRDVPCQGPWCSGSHAPMTTPVSTPDQVRDSWACWWTAFVLDGATSFPHRATPPVAVGVERSEPIFHPPRGL